MGHVIDRYHDISTGHRVHGHESKCAHLHGHNYRIFFQVELDLASGVCHCGDSMAHHPDPLSCGHAPLEMMYDKAHLDKLGRVIDFSVIKSRLCEWLEENWDHKFLVWEKDPFLPALREIDPSGVVEVTFNPTAENMAEFLVNVVGPVQLEGTGVKLTACRIEETRKCAASYYAEDE